MPVVPKYTYFNKFLSFFLKYDFEEINSIGRSARTVTQLCRLSVNSVVWMDWVLEEKERNSSCTKHYFS